MKKSLAIFLRVVTVVLGLAVLALLLWEPHIEGRNAHATLFQIYFNDPFLAYAYVASLSFFVALYQTFKLFGYIGQNQAVSLNSVRALRTIKYCGIILAAFIVGAESYLLIVRPGDDIAGGVAMGLFLIIISAVFTTVAAVFEKRFAKP
jgi:hypothetical protein